MLESPCNWLLMLDSDNILTDPNTIERLFAHRQPFISALYYRRHPNYNPAMWKLAPKPSPEGGKYQPILDWPKGQLIEVDVIGMGCCLIHRRVFEKIQELPAENFLNPQVICEKNHWTHFHREEEKPEQCPECGSTQLKVKKDWFEWTLGRNQLGVSEDFDFCEKVKKAGFPILIDTSIICHHDVSAMVGDKGIVGYPI